MENDTLLAVARRLVTDSEFRSRVMINPRETLADLGLSAQAYDALVALVPVLLAGGLFLLNGGGDGGQIASPTQGWGRPKP